MADRDIVSLLKAAFDQRKPLCKVTDAMRLVNGKGDGLEGLIIDRYAGHFAVYVFDCRWQNLLPQVQAALEENFTVGYLIVKDRSTTASSAADNIPAKVLVQAPPVTIVQEYGLNFEVDLNDGLNAGLFLDMRANRHRIGKLCRSKKVLNCFAYTCAFGVHARANGATEVVNVDLSRNYLNRGRRNYAFNKLPVGRGEFLCFDAAAFLSKAVKKDNRFDVIILDPPSFARNGAKTFQVGRDVPKLIEDAVGVVEEGGTLFVSTNFTGIGHSDLERMIKKNGRPAKHLERWSQDVDFPGSNTFKESYLVGIWAKF